MNEILENVDLDFMPVFKVEEGESGKGLRLGGVALTEGTSKNGRTYTFKNLEENNQKQFKFLVGHPKPPMIIEDHVVGKGSLVLEGNELKHDGIIMNTARHPDVIEKVKAGLLAPSIHARAARITKNDGQILVEGLDIGGMGLVTFPGVKTASIDYAIAESFDKLETSESLEEDEIKTQTGDNMAEEEVKKPEEETKTEVKADVSEEPKESDKRLELVEQELANLKNEKKASIVESIVKLNKDLKKEDLMNESEDKLSLILEYENKLSAKVEEAGIVEGDEATTEEKVIVESNDGSATLSESGYSEYNKSFKEKVM